MSATPSTPKISGLVQKEFASSTHPFSLHFKDPVLESAFAAERVDRKNISITTKRFLVMLLSANLTMHLLDILAAVGLNPYYTFDLKIWLFYGLIFLIILAETLCYCYVQLAPGRGIFVTVFGCLAIFHNNISNFVDQVFYPYTGSDSFLWAASMVYIHMHYMKNWMVSLVTYLAVFTEIMVLIMYYCGPHFLNEPIGGTVVDILYFVVVYASFSVCSVYAIRVHEQYERSNFYGRYQQELEIKEWKKLLDDIPEPVLFTHRGDIHFFNKSILKLFNITSSGPDKEGEESAAHSKENTKEDVKSQLACLRQKVTKKSLKELMETRRFSGDLTDESLFVYRKDANDKKALLTIKCVQTETGGSDEDDGIVEYIFNNVTALKALEKNKAKEKFLYLLLATASHDIRTPLNIMLGVLDSLEDCTTPAKGRELINISRNCGEKMLHYIKGLSFIRKISLGELSLDKAQVNPVELVKSLLRNVEFSAREKRLKLALTLGPNKIPETICTDREMYSIVLLNLLENAIKYTFSGSVTVRLTHNPDTSTLSTAVIDTGIGMTDEQRLTIGTLFKKSSTRCTLNPQGIGLGLFLAKTLTEHLNGDLKFDSICNQGSTAEFSITCHPLEEAGLTVNRNYSSMQDTCLPLTMTQIPVQDCNCPKILLVDDEPLNLFVLSSYLESTPFKADRAENGKIALDMIERRAMNECCKGYTIVFMDINMPVMDGVETTTRIRDWVDQGKIPGPCYIVAVTAAAGLDNPGVYADYLEKGFTELIPKPVHKTEFLQVLNKYFWQSQETVRVPL